jgi:TP53 regulating kinase-like protein
MVMKLMKKGAEADIYQTLWQNSKAILKIRKIKNYRNSILDSKIRKQRTIKESQIMSQIKSFGIPTPLVYFVNLQKTSIMMQEIPGKPIHDLSESKIIEYSKEIGKLVGRLHKNGIMHGDLTTSNFILFKNTIFVIDFGLSQNTIKPEDHAVDLRLIKEILNSAHAKIMKPAWKNFLSGYKSVVGSDNYTKILKLVSDIESRGRYAQVV